MEAEMICKAMIEAEKQAAELLMQAQGIVAETKSGKRDVVTEFDRRVQQFLSEKMLELLPDAGFFCEELDQRDAMDREHLFIIDPIDGTMNFVKGFNHSCISMAYLHRDTVTAAAIYNPYVDEMFSAVKGGGAYLNGKAIHAENGALRSSVVCVGTAPYEPELSEQTFALARKMFEVGLDIRRQGSAELDLCSVAAGRAGLYVEMSVAPWDFAAGKLIVEEAGGLCCRLDGSELVLGTGKTDIAAGGPRTMEDFLHLK